MTKLRLLKIVDCTLDFQKRFDHAAVKTVFCFMMIAVFCVFNCRSRSFPAGQPAEQPPIIQPDYQNLIVPFNVAPLNFRINEPGDEYAVRLAGEKGTPVVVYAKSGCIQFPLQFWRACLENNRGGNIAFDIAVKKEGLWTIYPKIMNHVADEAIDSVLVYRLIRPAHNFWGKMGLYQRDLTSFEVRTVIENTAIDHACLNCHAFNQNRPMPLMFHSRGNVGSALMLADQKGIRKINTKTAFNKAPAAYRSWHPSGLMLAFSTNRLVQLFHAAGETREVSDLASDLMLYHIDDNRISTFPCIASSDCMETFPHWSPDGRYLYYCSAPKIESFITKEKKDIGQIYQDILYDIKRIEYDVETETWGGSETVLASEKLNKSLIMPRISPDGRFMLFTGTHHGSFPVFVKDSDLYLMDMQTGHVQFLNVNSNDTESYHGWSSNSRWIVFSSKRMDGLCARPYFAYVHASGETGKPFVLPQEDPDCYEWMEETFNVPELITGRIQFDSVDLAAAVLSESVQAGLDGRVNVDAMTEATVQEMRRQIIKQ